MRTKLQTWLQKSKPLSKVMFKVSPKCVWHLFIKQSFYGIMGGECCLMQRDLTASSSTTPTEQREQLQSKAINSRPWITWGSSGFACNQLQMNRCHITLSHFCAHFDWPAHTLDLLPSIASLSLSWHIKMKERSQQNHFTSVIWLFSKWSRIVKQENTHGGVWFYLQDIDWIMKNGCYILEGKPESYFRGGANYFILQNVDYLE